MSSPVPSSKRPSGSHGAGLNAVRTAFLDYFKSNGHEVSPSAPLVPQDDPTLLFVNAGMVPFKNIFTGVEPAFAPRAASSQKCVRAGGKHNDLDNVGYTARHHTFFEMLGNFSFGDYFKEEAIVHAWTMLRDVFQLPEDKLLITVYADDEDAAALWRKVSGFSDDKIIRIGTSDNFWSMGDTGPCGPCSEIFYDHGPEIPGGPPGSPDEDGDRFIEIWNLVFMQFDQSQDGARTALPKPSIDTGMGLERISAVLQGVHNNYETDLFKDLIAAEEELYGAKASGDALASLRVIADHLRASAFLIADGVTPDNDGRGYVLRRIMRRAMRHGHLLGAREPAMHRLTGALVDQMGDAYPELVRAAPAIETTLEQEEARFQRTLGRGLALLEDETAQLAVGGALPGETAFKLYDTFGFPLDLTQDVLRARGLSVDEAGFDAAMAQQRARAQASWQGASESGGEDVWFKLRERVGPTEFLGYAEARAEAILKAMIVDGDEVKTVPPGRVAELIFDRTPFYGESGGQAGDYGVIEFASGAVFDVQDVQKRAGDVFVHIGKLRDGAASAGDTAQLVIDTDRRGRIRANHSATHLLHAALRRRLGAHVTQKGSLVEADKLRFDFAHGAALSSEDIEAIEAEVNAVIRDNGPAETQEMAPEDAVAAGALALFGEKYGDKVRVLSLGEEAGSDQAYSVELCGGTHVARTGDIGVFVITSESGVSAGVRRIEATCGADAIAYLKARAAIAEDIADTLKSPLKDTPARISALLEQRKSLEAQLSDAKRKLAMGGSGASGPIEGPEDLDGVKLIARVADGVPPKDLRGLIDQGKQQLGSGVVAFVAVNDGKAAVATGVTDDLTERFSAVDLVRAAATALGGKGGGGRPDMAQAGGPDGDKAEAALDAVRAILKPQ